MSQSREKGALSLRRGLGVVTIPEKRGRRAVSRFRENSSPPRPRRRSPGGSGGGRRSPPVPQPRPGRPRPAVGSLPSLRPLPGVGSVPPSPAQGTARLGSGANDPRRSPISGKVESPAHLASAAPCSACPAALQIPRCLPAPCSPARCLGFHCSAAAPPRPPLRLRARLPRRLQVPSGPAAFSLTTERSRLIKLQLPTP